MRRDKLGFPVRRRQRMTSLLDLDFEPEPPTLEQNIAEWQRVRKTDPDGAEALYGGIEAAFRPLFDQRQLSLDRDLLTAFMAQYDPRQGQSAIAAFVNLLERETRRAVRADQSAAAYSRNGWQAFLERRMTSNPETLAVARASKSEVYDENIERKTDRSAESETTQEPKEAATD